MLPRGAGGQGGDPERRPRRSLHQPSLREAQDHPRGPQHRRRPRPDGSRHLRRQDRRGRGDRPSAQPHRPVPLHSGAG